MLKFHEGCRCPVGCLAGCWSQTETRLKVQSWIVVLDIGYKRAFTVHVIHRCCTPGESNVTNI